MSGRFRADAGWHRLVAKWDQPRSTMCIKLRSTTLMRVPFLKFNFRLKRDSLHFK